MGALGLVALAMLARPLLRSVDRMAHGRCPFGYDLAASPAQRERAELTFARSHRGESRASARPALGFVLERTTRSEIIAALAAYGVVCKDARGLADLSCADVPSQALLGAAAGSPPRTLWLTFGQRQQLLAVIAVSRAAQPTPISATFESIEQMLERATGASAQARGDVAPMALARGMLNQASIEFRFTNYYALARATNMGRDFLLTEEYRALPD